MPQNKPEIPEWMKTQNDYSPKTDKNGFLAKTMLNFLKLFRHFHIEKNEKITVARAGGRTILVLGLIILSALSQNFIFCGFIAAGFLVYLCSIKIEILKRVLATAFTASIFTALIMLPSFFIYKSNSVITITVKVFLSTGMLSLYSLITPWNKITAALRLIRIPNILIFILDLTIHYILILGNVAFEMLFALKLRSLGKDSNKQKGFSGILGTVFLKSIALTEETQDAMECRLFDGKFGNRKIDFNIKDFLPILVLILYIFVFIYTS